MHIDPEEYARLVMRVAQLEAQMVSFSADVERIIAGMAASLVVSRLHVRPDTGTLKPSICDPDPLG